MAGRRKHRKMVSRRHQHGSRAITSSRQELNRLWSACIHGDIDACKVYKKQAAKLEKKLKAEFAEELRKFAGRKY